MPTHHDPSSFDVLDYAVRRGLIPATGSSRVTELIGGVSGYVVRIDGDARPLVIKRALSRLKVSQVWEAKPERALTEAAALGLCHRITPDSTPAVLDVDRALLTFAMSAAPPDWLTWKAVLQEPVTWSGDALWWTRATAVADRLGEVLAHWHRTTWADPLVASAFADYEALEQLRLEPFHRATAARNPQFAGALLGCADELRDGRDCLVHGDYSPKNVLVGSNPADRAEGVWVVDFEVAHVGAAVFDLAFMLCHLILKAAQMPFRAHRLVGVGSRFLAAYTRGMGDLPVPANVALHTSALLLARLDGRSPVGYLSADAAATVRRISTEMLTDVAFSATDMWELVTIRINPKRPTSEPKWPR